MRLQRANRVAAEAAFKDIDAPELLAFFENIRDAAKVIVPAAVRLRPLDAMPLQEVIRHQVAMLIGGSAVHIPAPAPVAQHDNARNRLPLVLRQKEGEAIIRAVQAQDLLVKRLVVDKELIALAGRLVNLIERIQIGLPLAL